jgi:hypothetical protein
MMLAAEEDPGRQVALSAEQLAAVAGPGGQPPYLHAAGSGDDVKAATHWVAADLASKVRFVTG